MKWKVFGGIVVVVLLVLGVLGFISVFSNARNNYSPISCLEAHHSMVVDLNKTCVHDNGDLSLFVEMISEENKDFLGLRLGTDPKYTTPGRFPDGRIDKRFIDDTELITLVMADYNFSKKNVTEEILVEGDYEDLEYLAISPAIISSNRIEQCIPYDPVKMVISCDE